MWNWRSLPGLQCGEARRPAKMCCPWASGFQKQLPVKLQGIFVYVSSADWNLCLVGVDGGVNDNPGAAAQLRARRQVHKHRPSVHPQRVDNQGPGLQKRTVGNLRDCVLAAAGSVWAQVHRHCSPVGAHLVDDEGPCLRIAVAKTAVRLRGRQEAWRVSWHEGKPACKWRNAGASISNAVQSAPAGRRRWTMRAGRRRGRAGWPARTGAAPLSCGSLNVIHSTGDSFKLCLPAGRPRRGHADRLKTRASWPARTVAGPQHQTPASPPPSWRPSQGTTPAPPAQRKPITVLAPESDYPIAKF